MKSVIYKGITFYEPDYDERNLNRKKTSQAIIKGILQRQPCEICKDIRYLADAHHEKYSDYLNVRWLCRPHHKLIHNLFKNTEDKINDEIIALEKYLVEHPHSMMAKIMIEDCNNKLAKFKKQL